MGQGNWQNKVNGASNLRRYPHGYDARAAPVINVLTLALTHALMALAAWRLLARRDLDEEADDARAETRPWLKKRESGDA